MADPAQSSDDALYFSNSSSGPDLFDASADPDGKGGIPQFKHRSVKRPVRSTVPTSLTPGRVTNLTPGAKYIP